MAEIDIDKMLEQNEQKMKAKEKQAKIMLVAGIAAGVLLLAGAIALIVMMNLGEKSIAYFPLGTGLRNIYNISNGNPEEWVYSADKADVDGAQAFVLNRQDHATHLSNQEYYYVGKDGISKLAFSANFGPKKKSGIKLLPARLKKGMKFDAGLYGSEPISAVVEDEEEYSTAAGTFETLRVNYDSGKSFKRTIWYSQNVGVVKIIDHVKNQEISIIKAGNQ